MSGKGEGTLDGAFRIAILGDDFTPSALFEEALRQTLGFWPGELVFSVADMADDDLVTEALEKLIDRRRFGGRGNHGYTALQNSGHDDRHRPQKSGPIHCFRLLSRSQGLRR